MKLKILVLVAFMAMSVSGPGMAFESGGDMLLACEADYNQGTTQALAKVQCFAYITGILDGIQLIYGINPDVVMFCPPKDGMSADQQVRIVTKWLNDNPSELHQSARMSVLFAFFNAFPCE